MTRQPFPEESGECRVLVWDHVCKEYLFAMVETFEDGGWGWLLCDTSGCYDRDHPERFSWCYLPEHP